MMERWKVITMGAIAAAISAILLLVAQVNDLVPNFVLAEELEEVRIELAGGVSANAANVLGIQRRDTRRSLVELRTTIKAQGGQATADQRELLRIYEDDIDRIDKALRDLQ